MQIEEKKSYSAFEYWDIFGMFCHRKSVLRGIDNDRKNLSTPKSNFNMHCLASFPGLHEVYWKYTYTCAHCIWKRFYEGTTSGNIKIVILT